MARDHPFAVAGVVTCLGVAVVASAGVVALPDPTSVVWLLLAFGVLAVPTVYVVGRRLG